MPKRKAAPTLKAQAARASRRRPTGQSLVWVDQIPLRQDASEACQRELARLEKARADWKRFEREDQPAFRRWVSATFGPLLTDTREAEALLREKEALVDEVEHEMSFRPAGGYRASYARVQERRAHPAAEEARSRQAPPPGDQARQPFDDEDEASEFEQELLFAEFARVFLGINPDRMSDRQYDRMFAEFQRNILGSRQHQAPPKPEPELPAEPLKSPQLRVKELYRLLVRRLHPDLRADRDAEVSALWHEVQEAYNHGNIERLEMLLALTDIQSNTAGEHTSLSQMRSVLLELRAAYRAVQHQLTAAKKDDAWNFARRRHRQQLEGRVRRQLESRLGWFQNELRQIEALIARWAAPAKGRKARKKPASAGSSPRRPTEFSF